MGKKYELEPLNYTDTSRLLDMFTEYLGAKEGKIGTYNLELLRKLERNKRVLYDISEPNDSIVALTYAKAVENAKTASSRPVTHARYTVDNASTSLSEPVEHIRNIIANSGADIDGDTRLTVQEKLMDKEKLNELWEQVKNIGKVEHLSDDAMLALGSVFGQMSSEIEFLNSKLVIWE